MRFKHLLHLFLVLTIWIMTDNVALSPDIHYSQFYNSPQNLNPAVTGSFNGDHRLILSHRDQWRFVPVPWTTFSVAYDRNIMPFHSEKHFYGVGLNVNYDRQGDSRLTLSNIGLNGAFHKLIGLIGSRILQ